MPYFLLWMGVVLGILLYKSQFQIFVYVVCGVLSFLFAQKSQQTIFLWVKLLFLGALLGAFSSHFSASPVITVGEVCQVFILKKYDHAVMARVAECGHKSGVKSFLYVSCSGFRCKQIYTRQEVIVTESRKFGRFQGKARFSERELHGQNLPVYYQILILGDAFKQSYYRWLSRHIPEVQSSLISSMLFGEVSLPTSLKDSMKDLGVLHIIAISGVNIVYLQSMIRGLIFRFSRSFRYFFELLVLLFLYFIVGEAVSLVRAILTVIVGILLKLSGVKVTPWHFFLGISVLLLLDSTYLYDAGYWLVSGACFGVYIGGEYIGKHAKARGFIKELLLSIVIWLCVAPVQLLIFRGIQPLGIAVGLVLAPLVEIASVLGYAGVFIRFWPGFERLFSLLLGIISSVILLVVSLFHGEA